MPKTVDLRQKPYQLDDQQVALVEDTLAGLSLAGLSDEEKIGQLFVNLFFFGEDAFRSNQLSNKYILANYHIGGAR